MKNGRPAYVPSDKHRRVVLDMASDGYSQRQIARLFTISVPTFKRHFAEEIHRGAVRMRAHAINMWWDRAVAGDVRAQIKVLEMTDWVDARWQRN